MVLKNASRIVSILLVGCTTASLFSENQKGSAFRNGILLLNNGPALSGEVSEFEDFYFIRNSKVGKKIPKDQVTDFISEEYYKKIKNSSSFRNAWKSLLYWNASADTQWRGFPREDVATSGQFEDSYTFWIKVALLLLTAAAYADTNQQNHSLKNAYSGFNEKEKRTFQNSYATYQAVAAITIGFFSFTTVKAYVRFGRNENYKDLQIQGRELKSVGEAFDSKSPLSGIPTVQFGITQTF
ncbi:hypothetical protein LEP1GSC060_3958 [Leptospira weilii serovar Ranarum str. ICFT]|uniref:Uncharacterized protein n=1 Tax=Leptospira weilii serovar Ranarum str. ICFT TaxID=1218598 RepID=N1WMU8_9LEPT|nr:hypothetical protein [Leptospira weilii]EMY78557.1 hypothetical protein LEP1GSC060_3958 [Leptospira weilii serovar Ranarum str. ICFT]